MIRRPSTEDILGQSLHELMGSKPLGKITVKEIAGNCGMTTMTFYRHFHDKYELAFWIQRQSVAPGILRLSPDYTWKDFLQDRVSYLVEDRRFYINLYRDNSGQIRFMERFAQNHFRLLESRLKEYYHLDSLSEDVSFELQFYLAGCSLFLETWLCSGMKYSQDKLIEHFIQVIPSSLRPYLDFA